MISKSGIAINPSTTATESVSASLLADVLLRQLSASHETSVLSADVLFSDNVADIDIGSTAATISVAESLLAQVLIDDSMAATMTVKAIDAVDATMETQPSLSGDMTLTLSSSATMVLSDYVFSVDAFVDTELLLDDDYRLLLDDNYNLILGDYTPEFLQDIGR
jgi:hypothetical protein